VISLIQWVTPLVAEASAASASTFAAPKIRQQAFGDHYLLCVSGVLQGTVPAPEETP
jgi:hypothetical protein